MPFNEYQKKKMIYITLLFIYFLKAVQYYLYVYICMCIIILYIYINMTTIGIVALDYERAFPNSSFYNFIVACDVEAGNNNWWFSGDSQGVTAWPVFGECWRATAS